MSPGNFKKKQDRPGKGPEGLDNYGLTDDWLRHRLKGRSGLLELPPPDEENWPRWQAALTAENPSVRGAAELLLAQPVDLEEVDHFRLLARQAQGLIEVWQTSGSEEVLDFILHLAEGIDDWPGLEMLLQIAARPDAPPELAHRLAGLERNREFLPRAPAPPAIRPPGDLLAWGRWGQPELDRFQALLELWASELAAVNAITSQISRNTGRVVVALFNANLAASLAWGAPDPFSSLNEDKKLEFSLLASEKLPTARQACVSDQAQELKQAWLDRGVIPPLHQSLTGLAGILDLNGRPWESAGWLDKAKGLTGRRPFNWLQGPWPLSLRPIEVLADQVEAAISRGTHRLANWANNLALALAWARAGRQLITTSSLPGLVVPLIGKFSASTRAGLDSAHLANWLGFLRRQLPGALFLLFDDTDRPVCALTKVVAGLENSHGLGPFGELEEADPAALISDRGQAGELYAVRPRPHSRRCRGLAEIMTGSCQWVLDPESYDPCWKDGLSVLLSGTGEAPVAPPEGAPLYPEYLTTTTGRWPLGLWCRLKMRPRGGGWLEPERELRLS